MRLDLVPTSYGFQLGRDVIAQKLAASRADHGLQGTGRGGRGIGQELELGGVIDRLHQVIVEAGGAGFLPIFVLPPASQGHQQRHMPSRSKTHSMWRMSLTIAQTYGD